MQLIIDLGGIEVLSNVLVSLMSAKSAAAVMGLTSGIMSWFSSSSGVVMPTLLPTVPHVAQQLGGVNEFELASEAAAESVYENVRRFCAGRFRVVCFLLFRHVPLAAVR